MPKLQTCAACERQQELPAIFCEACGAALIRISKILLTTLLTLCVTAYVVFGLYADKLTWPAPLYGLYVLLFVVFSYAVTRRHSVISLRMLIWSCAVLGYAMWFFWLGVGPGLKMLTSDIRDLIEVIESNPISQWVVLGIGSLCLLGAFIALYMRFGLTLAYRISLTLLAGATFAMRWAFSYSIGETGAPVSPRLSDWFTWAPETTVKELLELVSVNTLRVVIAEMAVYSFVKAYKPATEHFQRILAGQAAPAAGKAHAGGAFMDAITRVSNGVLRTALLLQHFAIVFGHTLANYAWGVYRVARRVFLDFVLPLGTLVAIAILLAMLAEHTGAYILGRPQAQLMFLGPIRKPWMMIPILFVAVFGLQMIFLAAVTKFPWRALTRCNFLLVLWIAPFFFAFFVFVSLSLVATGSVLRRWDAEFPYRIGPFTIGASAVLLVLIAYAVIHNLRSRHQIATPAAEHETVETPPVVEPTDDGRQTS